MEISKGKQVITIPKSQYDEMEKIVNEKKDITVSFYLTKRDWNDFGENIYISYSVYELNKIISSDDILNEKDLIKAAVTKIEDISRIKIQSLESKLDEIKSKWWYKLFTMFK